MKKYRWAVIKMFMWNNELQIQIALDDFDSLKRAEKFRLDFLNDAPKLDPQMVQVIQYVASNAS